MAKYRVGQMVRVLREATAKPSCAIALGVSATIVGIDFIRGGIAYRLDVVSTEGKLVWARECALRPIYDGDLPASWEDCAWKPEKETA